MLTVKIINDGGEEMKKQEALESAYTEAEDVCGGIKYDTDVSLASMKKAVEKNDEVAYMEAKGDLLRGMSDTMRRLTEEDVCPYCLYIGERECDDCSFGKEKGTCDGYNGGSVWSRLRTALDTVNDLINEYALGCPKIEEEKGKRVLKLGNICVDGDQVTF